MPRKNNKGLVKIIQETAHNQHYSLRFRGPHDEEIDELRYVNEAQKARMEWLEEEIRAMNRLIVGFQQQEERVAEGKG